MERKACTTRSDLENMLVVETAEPKALPLLLLQDITNDFSHDREIGKGGFAVVYKGIIGDRAVAVKRLSNACMDDKEFHREIQCLMRVKHKNVVRFLGYCADRQGSMAKYNGKFIMADIHQRLLCFEYIPKGSLDKYIIDAHREWRTCYKIIKGICEGLQFLHDNRIVHLDLKPANILLNDSMIPKITDFGLSRCFDENQSRDITKTILGTMGYLAPEFREGGEIATSADLYSLGVIIIEILTGQKGYQAAGNVLESWSDKLERSHRDTLSEQIRVCYEIALECIDFNPKKRPARVQDIIDKLHRTESIKTAASCSSRLVATESKGKSKDVSASSEPSHAMTAPPEKMVVMPRPVGPALVQAASYDLVETKPLLPARLGPRGAAMATRVSSMYDMVERMHYLYVSVVKARDLSSMDITGAHDSYVELKVGDFKGVTWHMEKTHDPVWRQTFAFSRAHMQSSILEVVVKNKGTLRDEFVGRLSFDLTNIPSRLPPDSPLAPQWYTLSDSRGERLRRGEIMLAVWIGSQADEAFPEARHSEAHSLSPEALTNRRSQVYYSPKLMCLKIVVLVAADLISAEIGRPLAPTIVKIQIGSQIRRTRPGHPQGSANQTWNEEFMFVASEPFDDQLVVTVEEKVSGRDEPIGRLITAVASPYVPRNDLAESVPSKWFNLERCLGMVVDATTGTKHQEHSKTFASKVIPVASPSERRNYLSRWLHSPAKWFRLSPSRGMSVDEPVVNEAAADVTAADGTTGAKQREHSNTFASKIHLRTSLETAYHVPEELTRYSSDLQPAAETLRKSAIGVLEVGILSARELGDNKHPYCVAKYGAKWVRTRTLVGTPAPQWNEPYTWDVFDLNTVITIAVFDNNQLFGNRDGSAKDQRIGKVRVRLATLESNRVYTHYYPLMALNQSGLKKTGELHLAVRFTCTAWANMVAQYGWPLLPRMHQTNPISVIQMDYLRIQAMKIVATRLGMADQPLPREVVECMLEVDSYFFSLRRSKANFDRMSSLFSGVVSVAKWLDGISKWKNPLTTILVHVAFLGLVCYPELILPSVFMCMVIIGAWNYFRRPRGPPHIDTVMSCLELTDTHPYELDEELNKLQPTHGDTMLRWFNDVAYPDDLDEEFDTFPTSRPDDIVRRRYDRLRSLATTVQTVLGDLATQGERAHFLLRWRDPRVTSVFMTLFLVVAIVLYLTPFRPVAMVMGLYMLRPPWSRGRTNLLLNLYSRLPSYDGMMM